MGTKTIYYCDACKEETGQLSVFWHGTPSSFIQHADDIECKNEIELCHKCLRKVKIAIELKTNRIIVNLYRGKQ